MRSIYSTVFISLFFTGTTPSVAQQSLMDRVSQLETALAGLAEENRQLRVVFSKVLLASEIPCTQLSGRWKQAEVAQGRFLLGAGNGYNLGGEGGAATVTLTVNQMPAHSHTGVFATGEKFAMDNQPKFHPSAASGRSGVTGGNQPHENMPPYRVVYFCQAY